jgi:A/G-specific adenine glycosylase
MKAAFGTHLLAWYDENARDLPWRAIRDPYRVWLSEIMLQQTRVAAVIAHYQEFLRRFPTVEKLAAAREASVLAAWSGLGYYRRARMLHAAAKVVTREHGGRFPETTEELRELPGIGRYTAAAIASIAFGKAVAVVDGNVERVLQRLSGKRLAAEELWQWADDLLDPKRPGDFNQAMMELGATVCAPRAPMCLMCPVVELCAVRGELATRRTAAPQKKREIHYALDCRDGKVFLVQRARDVSLMPGMWELPEVAAPTSGAKAQSDNGSIAAPKRCATQKHATQELDIQEHVAQERGIQEHATREHDIKRATSEQERVQGSAALQAEFTLRHSITVTDYTVKVQRMAMLGGVRGKWVGVDRLARLALTGLARKILRKANLLSAGVPPTTDADI